MVATVLWILHNFRIYITGHPQNHISDSISFHLPSSFFPSTNNKVIPKQLRRVYVKVFWRGATEELRRCCCSVRQHVPLPHPKRTRDYKPGQIPLGSSSIYYIRGLCVHATLFFQSHPTTTTPWAY